MVSWRVSKYEKRGDSVALNKFLGNIYLEMWQILRKSDGESRKFKSAKLTVSL